MTKQDRTLYLWDHCMHPWTACPCAYCRPFQQAQCAKLVFYFFRRPLFLFNKLQLTYIHIHLCWLVNGRPTLSTQRSADLPVATLFRLSNVTIQHFIKSPTLALKCLAEPQCSETSQFCDILIGPLNQGACGVSECEEMLAVTSFFNSLFRKVCCLVYINCI